MNKILKRLWAFMLVFSILLGFGGVIAKADTANPYVYVDENFKVTYMVNGTWGDNVTATIEIENIGNPKLYSDISNK